LRQFIDLLVYFANWAEDLTEIEQPAAGQNDTPAARWESVPEDDAQPEIVIASPAPARMIDGAVARFVDVQCDVSNGNLVLAKELYEGFQAWCRNTGQDDVSQRSFGMQLTAMGFQRRRRGRGKHWWDGIRLVAAAAPLIGETLVERSPELTNGHYEGYQAELPT
jgi:hypothetical protein